MRKPLVTLLVEQFRQTLAALCAGIIVVLAFASTEYAQRINSRHYFFDPPMFTAIVWFLICPVVMFFLYMYQDHRGFQVGLPKCWWLLPLPPRTVVFAQTLHKIISGMLFTLCAIWATKYLLCFEYHFNPYIILVPAVCAFNIWGVALACAISVRGPWKGILITLLFALAAAIFVWAAGFPLRVAYNLSFRTGGISPLHGLPMWLVLTGEFSTILTVLCAYHLVYELGWIYGGLASALFCAPQIYCLCYNNGPENAFSFALGIHFYAFAVIGYSWACSGAVRARTAKSNVKRIFGSNMRSWGMLSLFHAAAISVLDRLRLNAQLRAQIWLEWQQTARWLPVSSTLALAAAFLLIFSYLRNMELLFYVPFLLLPAAFGTGFFLERCSPAYLRFAAVRPLSTVKLAYAKLIAGAMGLAAAFGLIILLELICSLFFLQADLREIGAAILLAFAVTWMMLFTGRAALALAAALSIPFIAAMFISPKHGTAVTAVLLILEGAAVVCVIGYGVVMAHKRGFLSREFVLIAVLILLLGCVASFHDAVPDFLFFEHRYIAPLTLLCLTPFLWVPLILHRQRHQ